jgi:hypothetical protein
MKLIGLHALSHTDDNEHAINCTICDVAITHNLTPTITTDFNNFEIENNSVFVHEKITTFYTSIVTNNNIPREIFSRPPPFYI